MEEKNANYFKELSRVLNGKGVQTGKVESGKLPILLNGEPVNYVDMHGCTYTKAEDFERDDISMLRSVISDPVKNVKEYITLLENAPLLQSDSGNEDYYCLAEFNGIVLAGKEVEQHGYMFVTWERDADGDGFCYGNYYDDEYEEAKQNFATRAGLVNGLFVFTKEQAIEMYRCMKYTLENKDLFLEQESAIQSIASGIEYDIPDLQRRMLLNEQADTCPKMDL